MSRAFSLFIAIALLLTCAACDLVDPMRPSPQADSETFGNLLEASPDPTRPGVWIAKIRIGVPRALGRTDDARPTPDVADGIVAVVVVTADTIVLADDSPTALMDIGPGTEVVAIPLPGTTTMYGEKELHLQAAHLMDFETYAKWKMPKLELAGDEHALIEDPAAINSSGVETAPVPVGDGKVLYFTARLRPPETQGAEWIGARREGLEPPAEGARSVDRSYRTELGPDGWSAPTPVEISGIDAASGAKITWVSPDELVCYLTITGADGAARAAVSRRDSVTTGWGEPFPLEGTGEGDAYDAIAFTGDAAKTIFGSSRNGGGDLFMYDPEVGPAQPLQPEINTPGSEWAPRVGPSGELYFLRGDRQLRFESGSIDELRLPGPHRVLMIEAVPSGDGRWLFFVSPRFRPIEFDFDLFVAPIAADGSLGEAIPVDDWRG
jgi:hypothetical protein